MAELLGRRAAPVLAANAEDVPAAAGRRAAGGCWTGCGWTTARLKAIAGQLRALAGVPAEPSRHTIRELPGGLRLRSAAGRSA